jgi:hypothetical protein
MTSPAAVRHGRADQLPHCATSHHTACTASQGGRLTSLNTAVGSVNHQWRLGGRLQRDVRWKSRWWCLHRSTASPVNRAQPQFPTLLTTLTPLPIPHPAQGIVPTAPYYVQHSIQIARTSQRVADRQIAGHAVHAHITSRSCWAWLLIILCLHSVSSRMQTRNI